MEPTVPPTVPPTGPEAVADSAPDRAADSPEGLDLQPAVPTDAEILVGITEVARQHLDYAGPLNAEMRLVEDLELDSIRLLTLAVEVENRFQICLDEEDDRAIETVADLVTIVGRELKAEKPRRAPAAGPPGSTRTP